MYNGFGEKDMEIDYYKNPFASKRMNVIARNGVVCTGNNLATQAGLRMLLQGGNAVDAAIATAACLTVCRTLFKWFRIGWFCDCVDER